MCTVSLVAVLLVAPGSTSVVAADGPSPITVEAPCDPVWTSAVDGGDVDLPLVFQADMPSDVRGVDLEGAEADAREVCMSVARLRAGGALLVTSVGVGTALIGARRRQQPSDIGSMAAGSGQN